MKYFNKLTLFFLMLLIGYGIDTLSYTYTITNKTGRDLKVQLYRALKRKLNNRPKVIRKGKSHTFKFSGWEKYMCLRNIKVKSKQKDGTWGKMETLRRIFWNDSMNRKELARVFWTIQGCASRNFTFLWGTFPDSRNRPHGIFTGVYIKKN